MTEEHIKHAPMSGPLLKVHCAVNSYKTKQLINNNTDLRRRSIRSLRPPFLWVGVAVYTSRGVAS